MVSRYTGTGVVYVRTGASPTPRAAEGAGHTTFDGVRGSIDDALAQNDAALAQPQPWVDRGVPAVLNEPRTGVQLTDPEVATLPWMGVEDYWPGTSPRAVNRAVGALGLMPEYLQ